MVEQWLTTTEDTIALLHEEIHRLEGELRLREEALAESNRPAEPDVQLSNAVAERRLAELGTEVAKRDETIMLLLEQVRLLEEAEAAGRAEWEQLQQWVEEVERRVEGRDLQGRDLLGELDGEKRRVEAQRLSFETDRRAWETHRQALDTEVQQLRTKLTELARRPGGASHGAAVEALEEENRKLRAVCRELERHKALGAHAAHFRDRLQEVQNELAESQHEIRRLIDERERERIEHEAALAAQRRQAARESLYRQEEGDNGESGEPVTIDERIQALRLHLREIHDREAEERKNNRLSARLSRLWGKTGPAR